MTPSAEERLDALWHDHAPAVLRYARRRVGAGEVDEVLAETFVVAWRHLDDVPAEPLPWLLGIARRVAANLHRSHRRRGALLQRVLERNESPPDQVTITADESRDGAVWEALQSLPERDRELLTLLAWDGLSLDEIARVLGCSRGALRVRLHRARRRFAARLELCSTPRPARVRALPNADFGGDQ